MQLPRCIPIDGMERHKFLRNLFIKRQEFRWQFVETWKHSVWKRNSIMNRIFAERQFSNVSYFLTMDFKATLARSFDKPEEQRSSGKSCTESKYWGLRQPAAQYPGSCVQIEKSWQWTKFAIIIFVYSKI